MVWLRVWAQMAPEVSAIISDLVEDIGRLRRSCAQTRFRIALAVLHDAAVGQFVGELIDGGPGADEARPAIGELGRALDEGVALTATHADQNAVLAAATADRINGLRDLLDLPQTMIREWLARADRSSSTFAEMADAVQSQVDRTQADVDVLSTLAAECRRIAVPLETTPVEAQLARLRELQNRPIPAGQ